MLEMLEDKDCKDLKEVCDFIKRKKAERDRYLRASKNYTDEEKKRIMFD
jgi:hypothetical protein